MDTLISNKFQQMFSRLKKWLGVEGVKLEFELPYEINADEGNLHGTLHFYSMSSVEVTAVEIAFVERYRRGRGKEKLIDEYELGRIELNEKLQIEAEVPSSIKFEIPFTVYRSRMDEFEKKNFLTRGVSTIAKLAKNVKSTYRVEAKANVVGTALHPIAKKEVVVKL